MLVVCDLPCVGDFSGRQNANCCCLGGSDAASEGGSLVEAATLFYQHDDQASLARVLVRLAEVCLTSGEWRSAVDFARFALRASPGNVQVRQGVRAVLTVSQLTGRAPGALFT